MVFNLSAHNIFQQGQKHHLPGFFGFLKHYARPVVFSFLGWMLCLSYLVYDYTIYHGYLLEHIFSPPYLYEMFFHVMMIAFSPVLFMFIGYQEYRKTRYMTELEELMEKWRTTYDSIPDLIFVLDNEHHIVDANRATIDRLGPGIMGQQFCYSILSHEDPAACKDGCACLHKISIDSNQTVRREVADGFVYDVTCSPVFGRNSRIIGSVNIVKDITEQRRAEEEKKLLEAQLIQSQKMESLGRFAGGIAHDFNNLLTIILGNCELMQDDMISDTHYKQNIEQIASTAGRASELVSQILTFSRKEVKNPKPVHLNDLLDKFQGLLKRIIGSEIAIRIHRSSEDLVITGDTGKIEQVLMNLASNAKDAMPYGGTLTIRVQAIAVGQGQDDAPLCLSDGRYVLLTVSDTGSGIDEEIRKHIFEPFFTTKEEGKGTGLGLAIVYSIIRQHNGYIDVQSDPQQGTTFKIYLPAVS